MQVYNSFIERRQAQLKQDTYTVDTPIGNLAKVEDLNKKRQLRHAQERAKNNSNVKRDYNLNM